MTQAEKTTVKIEDLFALVDKQTLRHPILLFPQVRMPQQALDCDPNPEHRLAIQIPTTTQKPIFRIPEHWDDQTVSRVTYYRDEEPKTYDLWFPTNCDFRIRDEQMKTMGSANYETMQTHLVPAKDIFSDIQSTPQINPRLLEDGNEGDVLSRNLDGRLVVDSGTLEVTQKTRQVHHWGNLHDEQQAVSKDLCKNLGIEVTWKIELENPVFQAKRFGETEWQTIFQCPTEFYIFNSPSASFLGLNSWYKHETADQEKESDRSKHFQLFSKLFEPPIEGEKMRIPYYVKPDSSSARPGARGSGADCPFLYILE